MVAALALFSQSGLTQAQAQTALFKVVTDKDEIIIGLSSQELQSIGGAREMREAWRARSPTKSL